MSKNNINSLETLQGNLVKQACGLSKRSRSTSLLQALNICKVGEKVKSNIASLLYRVYGTNFPLQDLTTHFLSLYMCKGVLFPGTLIERAITCGLSPTYFF